MRVVVTGGGGRLGGAVTALLRSQGLDVLAVDLRFPDNKPGPTQLFADLTDLGQVYGALAGAQAVVHLGALPSPGGRPPETVFGNNTLGQFHVFEAAARLGIRRVVSASSYSAYGLSFAEHRFLPDYLPLDEDHPLAPQDPYGLSKVVGEQIAATYVRRRAGDAVSLRITRIVDDETLPAVLDRARSSPEAYAHELWSYVHLDDAARACLPAAPRGALPGAYFDPAGYARAVPDLFAHLRSVLGDEVELIHDVHERLAPADAVTLAARLAEYRMFYLEDPLPPEQTGWLERLRAHSSVPVAIGELFNHPHEWVPLISSRQIDFIRCHLSQLGGLTPARKLAALAETFGVRTAWHGPRDTSPVGHAAGLHLELASPNFGIHEWSGFPEPVYEVFDGCPREDDGYLYPSDRPGLGVEIDERAAARFPCDDTLPGWTLARTVDGSAARP